MVENSTVSFNISFLEESAVRLAASHDALESGRSYTPVKPILEESKKVLDESYRVLSRLAKSDQEISPAAEWLIDNFYIIQENIVQVGVDFPVEYQKKIPLFKSGDYKGLPKVYELVLNLMAHTDNMVDIDVLKQYVQNYQEVRTLMQGEIWAIPIMIRLILLQKLAEKATRILYRRNIRSDVQQLIDKIEKKGQGAPGEITNMISGWLKEHSDQFGDQLKLIELFSQLQSSGLLQDEQKRWFNYRFQQHDLSFEETMHIEAQKQSRLQVSIQNAVMSLRYTAETDWSDFSEECSKIDQILRRDPMGCFPEMDFQTRDSYRRTVERVSRRSALTETEVAEEVLLMAESQTNNTYGNLSELLYNHDIIKQHVGYFLVGEGYTELVKKTAYSMPVKERIIRNLEKQTGYYLSAIALHTLALLAILWVVTDGISDVPGLSVSVLLVAFFPVLDFSVTAVNRFFAFFLSPRILPKMNYDEGIPKESRTMVVVPTMFSSPQDVRNQTEALEIRSLANSDPCLQFALLSDFADAKEKNVEGDKAIFAAATEAIKDLNDKYSSKFGNKFYLLHRERLWNESETAWMGWERKRGKIEEFNKLICEPSKKTSYSTVTGDFRKSIKLQAVQFIITLDSDTELPPDSAKNLVSTIAHPLNKARYDHDKRRITQGYGIVQPRISIQPESARKTLFSRIFSGNVGIDPYSTAVSDIYQDLSGEAVFTGKGIYDVEAFNTVLNNRFPENRILSHDLIESTYLRTGLATDIELYDDFPSTYVSFSKRNHRWTRGDWQIAAWLFNHVPGQNGKQRNTINLLSKWKIFDNLRRSLNPLFLTVFFVAGWFWLPGSAWLWTAAAFGILAFPIYVSLSSDMLNRPARVRWKLYFSKVRANLKINSIQAAFTVMILPHQAVVYLDAIIRTLYRIGISKKSLLEWTTASKIESISPNSVGTYFHYMMFPVLLGVMILAVSVITVPHYLWIMAPFFLLWAGSPIYAWYASQPVKVKRLPFSEEEKRKLRTYARRTWFYFERFVNEDHSWLPPDNYQENPPLSPVARTSPTNMGLALVSVHVAYNMGYITFGELLERQQKTLESMSKLKRYKGHFFNWYETKQGEVLHPRYISTVDSGNLAASLIVVKEAVKQGMKSSGINKNFWSGMQDTIITLREIFASYNTNDALPQQLYDNITLFTSSMMHKLSNLNDGGTFERLTLLESLKDDAAKLSALDLLPMKNRLEGREVSDLYFWLEIPLNQIENAILEYKSVTTSMDADLRKYSPNELYELKNIENSNQPSTQFLKKWKRQAEYIITVCETFTNEMDFSFLYLKKRGLFSIGYNEEKAQLDKGTYDLLASEARIASYFAIAKGDVPVEHWFRLSRRLTSLNQNETLLSWSGTMFEYLMPLLFMRSYPDTLMSHTYQNVIQWQQEYGKQRNQPWGFSESAYHFLNIDMHYQYRAFGAPGLGLKRGLAEEYVIAPYATMLALMVKPKISLENLKDIEQLGGLGLYGFYDALDFTPSHLSDKVPFKVVKTYMAHHHGMSLIAIENLLNDWSINDYFHSDAKVRGCELILQERIPMGIPIKEPHPIDVELEPGEKETVQDIVEPSGMNELDISPPRLHILSNRSYSTFVTHAGTGSSKCRGIALNSWDPDPTIDPSGMFFYIKDLKTNRYWSAMHQPVKRKPDRYDTWFHNGKIVTSRVDDWIETTTEICVSPDHEIEFRKIILTNYSDRIRNLELTSYAEVVLNRPEDHQSHPAFSKLFVQTDYLAEHHSLIAKRRPRSDNEKPLWLIHTFAGHDQENVSEPLQFETERSNFIGRGRSLGNPAAMDNGYKMKGALGNVSDPIVSLRETIELGPGEKIQFTFGLGMAYSREEAVHIADIYDNQHATNRAFDLATVYSTVELNHIDITPKQAHYYQKLASYALYSSLKFRGSEKRLKDNRKKQQDLWAYGISGDLPLFVFIINDTDQLKRVKTLLKAHAFWRLKGLETELLILNDHPPSYSDEVQEAIHQSIETSMDRERMNKRGGVFVHKTDKMSENDLTLILSVAHAVFEQKLPDLFKTTLPASKTTSWYHDIEPDRYKIPALDDSEIDALGSGINQNLQLFNGYGGFTPDGDEYHILIYPDHESGKHIYPPAPWINVISNPGFGFISTEKGAGYTWSENSRENKLTAWSNDPVIDPHSEAFYIRDEEKKIYWSPTPGPVPGVGIYKVAHGFGYSRYEYSNDGLEQELLQFVPRKEPVKISRLTLTNNSDTKRKFSVFRYLDRVLGVKRNISSRFTIPEVLDEGLTLLHVNHYNNEFAGRTVFAAVRGIQSETELNFTTSRASFIGRNRSLEKPAALSHSETLDNETVTGDDPCAAFQATFHIEPGERKIFYFLEGEGQDRRIAEEMMTELSDPAAIEAEFTAVKESWKHKLKRIEITTPDKSMDLMVNGWLMYQNLSSRMWARTAFYQAGGAFGFRDQLQDAMAALYIDPEITKKQILLHASNQFREGDVLHWWHPPTGRGIRSRITDDRLWLPYVTDFYIESTGDESVLKEEVPYITARKLEDYEHEVYLHPEILDEKGTLYEHCCKAIDLTLEFGIHGLPLIGGGDWNDGMNRVGEGGKGESVWLGFFIYLILVKFERICKWMGDEERAEKYNATASILRGSLNKEGWDGEWYIRAFFDDGTPLGSSENIECKIDAISQAWSVISGGAAERRGEKALEAVEKHLISKQDRIIKLLTPPFDKTEKNPGYIKGYIPGVRENGGQYTHGALWVVKAFADIGQGAKAVNYFNMINPVNHALNREDADIYKVEPYVVAADVYGEQPLTGMGGWTWYTGSGGWMYRVALESILGFRLTEDGIILKPAISPDWNQYEIKYRADDDKTLYNIKIQNRYGLESGNLEGTVDSKKVKFEEGSARIMVKKDGKVHEVNLNIVSK